MCWNLCCILAHAWLILHYIFRKIVRAASEDDLCLLASTADSAVAMPKGHRHALGLPGSGTAGGATGKRIYVNAADLC